jgi:hypothetical protein
MTAMRRIVVALSVLAACLALAGTAPATEGPTAIPANPCDATAEIKAKQTCVKREHSERCPTAADPAGRNRCSAERRCLATPDPVLFVACMAEASCAVVADTATRNRCGEEARCLKLQTAGARETCVARLRCTGVADQAAKHHCMAKADCLAAPPKERERCLERVAKTFGGKKK